MMAYSEYPKAMNHPQFRPAIVSGYTRHPDGTAKNDAPGAPAKFPPVYVSNKDQELDYASRGYVPAGVSDAEAYMRAVVGADTPSSYGFQEFPKYVYQVQGGEVASALVSTEAEQTSLKGAWYATPDDALSVLADADVDPDQDDVSFLGEPEDGIEWGTIAEKPTTIKTAKKPKAARA
jgi:hypothetical protein